MIGTDEEEECNIQLREAYSPILGAVAWIALTGAELAVYVQAHQRQAHATRIEPCKRLNIVTMNMKRHKCGLKLVAIQHPIKFLAFTDAPFKAQPEETRVLALRGFAAVLWQDRGDSVAKPHGANEKADLVDFTVRRQRRVVRSTFSAEVNGRVDSIEQLLLLQCALLSIDVCKIKYSSLMRGNLCSRSFRGSAHLRGLN